MHTESSVLLPVACFLNMSGVGSLYATSVIASEMPRLLRISPIYAHAPFAFACCGLSFGVLACPHIIRVAGASRSMSVGTIAWGLAVFSLSHGLSTPSLGLLLAIFAVGGIGVGVTYLAVVVAVSRSLAHQPLAKSVIGPIGFSLGTAASILLAKSYSLETLDATRASALLSYTGAIITFVGVSTILVLPGKTANGATGNDSPGKAGKALSVEKTWSALLFTNALCGMTVFSNLIPLTTRLSAGIAMAPHHALAASLLALAAGGIFAPYLHSRLGPNLTFSSLFLLRGAALIVSSQLQSAALRIVTVAVIFFGHGAGFSIMPALIKSRSRDDQEFIATYSRVLFWWGFAGVFGSVVSGILASVDKGDESLLLLLGTFMLAASYSVHRAII